MKSIQHVIRKTLLWVVLALMASGTARATWFEQPVSNITEQCSPHSGGHDAVWNAYWCKSETTGKVYIVYNPGSGWTGATLATNCSTTAQNCLGVNPSNHQCFYSGNDGFLWVIWWNGSGWVSSRVGSNATFPSQICVDNVYNACWYVENATGHLWICYWNGSSWVEAKIDGTNVRYRIGRCSGVDSTWHVIWCLTNDRKSLRGTYFNGSAWVNGAPIGTPLPGAEVYKGICCQESTHTPFNWQENGSGTSTRGGYFWWNGSAWAPATCFQDANLPSIPLYCVPSPNPYCCFYGSGTWGVYFTSWCNYARTWSSCRLDNSSMSGGLYPLCSGQDGRAILCRPSSGNYVRMLFSDVP